MKSDSRDKDRIRFQEVAKLALTTKAPVHPAEERKDDSGMIHLGALAGADADQNAAVPASPVESPPGVSVSAQASANTPAGARGQATSASAPMRFELEDRTPGPPVAMFASAMASPPGRTPVPSSPRSPASQRVGALTPRSVNGGRPLPAVSAPPPRAQGPVLGAAPVAEVAAVRPAVAAAVASPSHETTRPTVMSTDPQKKAERKAGGGAILIALTAGIGLGALSTVAFFEVRDHRSAQSSLASARPPESVAAHTVAPAAHDDPSTAIAPGRSDSVPSPPVASIAEPLPKHAAAVEAKNPTAAASPTAAAQAGASAVAPAQTTEATAKAASAKAAPAKENPESLEALMKRAVGITATAPIAAPPPPEPEATASVAAGSVPLKPAMGAVQGAVGTVLPAARYCLGPDDPVSRAAVTFRSDGTVQGVSITGPAAGQPAEACIVNRLMGARVAPFSSPTFTWTVTVRPAS